MKFDEQEIDLEFIEQEAEDHLTSHEAFALGLETAGGGAESEAEWR